MLFGTDLNALLFGFFVDLPSDVRDSGNRSSTLDGDLLDPSIWTSISNCLNCFHQRKQFKQLLIDAPNDGIKKIFVEGARAISRDADVGEGIYQLFQQPSALECYPLMRSHRHNGSRQNVAVLAVLAVLAFHAMVAKMRKRPAAHGIGITWNKARGVRVESTCWFIGQSIVPSM